MTPREGAGERSGGIGSLGVYPSYVDQDTSGIPFSISSCRIHPCLRRLPRRVLVMPLTNEGSPGRWILPSCLRPGGGI